MKVVVYENENKLWDDYVYRSSYGTFFHQIGWKRVVEKTFDYPTIYLYTQEGNEISGCLPLFHVKSRWFGNALISVPFGVYGGIVADVKEAEGVLLETAKNISRELRSDYLELRHMEDHSLGLPTKDLYVCFQREIYEDLDKNMAAVPRKQRRMIRQGIKHGLVSVLEGPEALQGFYDIYAHSLRNLGTPVFPYSYFDNIMMEFGGQCRILSVVYQGKKVAAVMTFFYKDQVIPYYGGALRDYFSYAVNDFMYWELMRYGCEKGYKVFDFGRSKQGAGSYDFKRHWGFEPKPLHYQYFLNGRKEMPNLSPTNSRFKPLISLWKKLPLPFTKFIGPKIIKHLP